MSVKRKVKIPNEITAEQLWNQEKMGKVAAFIAAHAKKMTPEQRLRTEIVAIKYKIYSYLDNENIKEKTEILDFVKMYLKVLNISQAEFASKIGMKVPNMHKYFTGERKLNTDIVMKLSTFSHTKPELWYSIQSKNDLLDLEKSETAKSKYEKYDYENLNKTFKHLKTKSEALITA